MQDNTQSPRQILMHRLMLIGIGILVLAIVAVGTVLVLKNVIPKKVSTSSVMTANADEAVAFYSVPGAITGLSENLYEQQLNDGTSIPIIYKSPDHAYAVNTLTPYNVLFYSKDKTVQNDTKAIQDQTTVFMKGKGYQKVANSTDNFTSPKYVTYVSDSAVCQLISSGATSPEDIDVPISHQLACAEKGAIADEYNQTEKLLKLYNGSMLPNFSIATRTVVTEGDKAFAIVTLKNKPKTPILLFAAVHDTWSFIADLNGDGGESNGKYVITPAIKAKLSDSKYGDFLTRYIIGTTS